MEQNSGSMYFRATTVLIGMRDFNEKRAQKDAKWLLKELERAVAGIDTKS